MRSLLIILIITTMFFFLKKKARIKVNTHAISTYGLALAAMTITVSMVMYPEAAFEAAKNGLDVWWNTVFPALLPFFIGSEILMGLGVVRFMGTLLEPLMRPLFNVPGEGSFVMAMGLASGYPIGGILTSKLRRKNICNQTEAERLISFTNTADPLFMFGAVAVGMFYDPKLGVILAAGHYLSSLCVGLTMRFYRRSAPITVKHADEQDGNIVIRGLKALYQARIDDGRPFGQILGDSIKQSVNSLLMIGGFIIFFSVIVEIATLSGILQIISGSFSNLFGAIGIATNLAPAATSGVFEITMGTKLTSEVMAPLGHKMMLAGAIIAWSGLSVHAQVAAISNDTDIRMVPYMVARIWHAVLAGFFTLLIFNRANHIAASVSLPIFYRTANSSWLYQLVHSVYLGSSALLVFIALGVLVSFITAIAKVVRA